MQPQIRTGAQADVGGDLLYAPLRKLQELAGDVDAGAHDPLHRRIPRVVDEAPRERTRRDRGMPGQRVKRERLTEPVQRPLARGGEPLPQRLGHTARHVLCLTAAAVGGRDQTPGRVVGRGHPEVAAQDVQAQVDARGGAGRRQHAALVDEQDVLVDLDERMPRRECPRVVPVRRGASAVEQARGGEREGARRDGGEPRAPIVGGDQRVDDGLRRVVAVREPVAGDEDDVGPRERVEAVGDVSTTGRRRRSPDRAAPRTPAPRTACSRGS